LYLPLLSSPLLVPLELLPLPLELAKLVSYEMFPLFLKTENDSFAILLTLCTKSLFKSCDALATSLSMKSTSRAEFFQQIGVAAVSSVTLLPNAANAAKYGGFGAGSPEVISPKDAIIDDEILASESVQKAISKIKLYSGAVEEMKNALVKDSQADIGPYLRKTLEISELRSDLNTFNTAFDEDTQRGTDRLIRVVLQDIAEVEIANKQKEGVPRSQIRLDNLNGKLNKVSKTFTELLAFV